MVTKRAEPSSPAGLSARGLLLLVWTSMRDLYGRAWSSQYGETPSPAWAAALRDLSAAEIRAGLRGAVDSCRTFPPTAPEFRGLCRPRLERTSEQRALYSRIEAETPAALPSPEALAATSSTGRAWWAYWIVEGLRPPPNGVTPEKLDAMLDGYDLVAMRADVVRERDVILGRYGVEMTPERVER